MLELRPNCEFCDKDLPADSADAMICSYECTFCSDCVRDELDNVCPNCGGGFCPRPVRPQTEWRPAVSATHQPPSQKRVHLKHELADLKSHAARIREIDPAQR